MSLSDFVTKNIDVFVSSVTPNQSGDYFDSTLEMQGTIEKKNSKKKSGERIRESTGESIRESIGKSIVGTEKVVVQKEREEQERGEHCFIEKLDKKKKSLNKKKKSSFAFNPKKQIIIYSNTK